MAPRQQNQLNVIDYSHHNHNDVIDSSSSKQQQQHHQPRMKTMMIFFRIGPFRFGVHGIAGILGTIFVSYALYQINTTPPSSSSSSFDIPPWLSLTIVITTLTTSIGSYNLLSQVPNTSQISSWIIPPHKEAFKRTIAIIGYLNLRLVHQWQSKWFSSSSSSSMIILFQKINLLFPILLSLYTIYHFFPLHLDYKNGNTWVFVVPMFVGFTIDSMNQFPKIMIHNQNIINNDNNHTNIVVKWISNYINHAHWDDVHNWNQNKVNEKYLLLTLLCALQIAFMFTVAFRGKMSIKVCYWIAAVEVGLLCVRLVYTA